MKRKNKIKKCNRNSVLNPINPKMFYNKIINFIIYYFYSKKSLV